MLGIWKHIHGDRILRLISVLFEALEVSGKGRGVAGDVDNAVGGKFLASADE